jgi:protein-S-isoprenylcysteine O-methyltransferase Ste14
MKDPTPGRFACGTVLVLAGACLRFWAKGFLTQGLELTTAGPYACCRHPFYFGNLLLDLGICLLIGRVDVLLAYSVLWFVIHHRQMKKEEQDLRLLHGAERYDQYAREVPRLIPWRFLSGLRREGTGEF